MRNEYCSTRNAYRSTNNWRRDKKTQATLNSYPVIVNCCDAHASTSIELQLPFQFSFEKSRSYYDFFYRQLSAVFQFCQIHKVVQTTAIELHKWYPNRRAAAKDRCVSKSKANKSLCNLLYWHSFWSLQIPPAIHIELVLARKMWFSFVCVRETLPINKYQFLVFGCLCPMIYTRTVGSVCRLFIVSRILHTALLFSLFFPILQLFIRSFEVRSLQF